MSTKPLFRIKSAGLYWLDDVGAKHAGNCTGLRGNCTGLSGDCTGLWGDCTGLRGNCTGLSGNCTGLRGNCTDIPSEARPCTLTAWIQEP